MLLDTLLVVAKEPAPGRTKTRLCPPLTPAQAAGLYECFLRDTLETMRRVPHVRRAIAYLPQGAGEYFRRLAPDMDLTVQRGQSLGERLDSLLTEALTNARKAVVVDSDSPTLPAEYLRRAFELLDPVDVVLGPARDGGYYLIGLKQPQPHLLRQVPMSTPHVLSDTLAHAESSGLSVALLPEWYDVDTVADLDQLARDALESANPTCAPATRNWLKEMNWAQVPT